LYCLEKARCRTRRRIVEQRSLEFCEVIETASVHLVTGCDAGAGVLDCLCNLVDRQSMHELQEMQER
jgi:hypothetical protein